jgi:hypothetical protein
MKKSAQGPSVLCLKSYKCRSPRPDANATEIGVEVQMAVMAAQPRLADKMNKNIPFYSLMQNIVI